MEAFVHVLLTFMQKSLNFFLGGVMSCKYYLSVTEVADLFREIL